MGLLQQLITDQMLREYIKWQDHLNLELTQVKLEITVTLTLNLKLKICSK